MQQPGECVTQRGVAVGGGAVELVAEAAGGADEEVFTDPFRFDVGRDPNRHLSFGYGVHFCVASALARMEIASFLAELVPRLDSLELAGDPQLIATTFVGGVMHLPIRYTLR